MRFYQRHPLAILLLILFIFVFFQLAAAAVPNGWQPIGRSMDSNGINNSSNLAKLPKGALGPSGDLFVVWEEQLSPTQQEIFLLRWDGSSWVEMAGSASNGGVSNQNGLAENPAVAVDSEGRILVAWYARDSVGIFQVYTARFADGQWQTVQEVSDSPSDSIHPRVAFSPDDVPYVVWQEETLLATNVMAMRFTNDAWQEVGNGVSSTINESTFPDIAIGPDETPLVVWVEDLNGNSEIFARRWNGNLWVQQNGSATNGGISNTGGSSEFPKLSFSPDGTAVVAWEDRTSGTAQIYVRQLLENRWREIGNDSADDGGVSNTNSSSLQPGLFAGSQNNIFLVWQDWSAPDFADIYIRHWNGSEWQEVGDGSASDAGISDTSGLLAREPSVFLSQNETVYVIWEDGEPRNGQTIGIIRGRQYSNNDCQSLTLASTGAGEDPTATPPNSAGCPSGSFLPGEEILLTAVPDSGAAVVGWDNTDDDDSTETTNSITMPDTPLTITVNYTNACLTLTLSHTGVGADPTASPNNSPGCPAGSYLNGTAINLTANPSTGWEIASWTNSSNDSSNSANNSVTMPAQALAVAVNYVPQADDGCFTLQTVSTGEGEPPVASPSQSADCAGNGRYSPGQQISLTASPAGGWEVASWNNTANDGSTSTSNSVTMPIIDLTVTVNYARVCYPLTLASVGEGAEPQSQSSNSAGCLLGEFAPGERVFLSAAPQTGWEVTGWQNSENDDSTSSSNSVLMPSNPLTVSVIYEQLTVDRLFTAYLPLVLRNSPQPPSTDEQEPNNGVSSATGPLISGLLYNGLPNDQEDIFFVEVGASGTVDVLVQNHSGSDVQLIVYEDELTSDKLVGQDASPGDTTYRVTINGTPGRYYVRIFTATGYSDVMPYTLRVTHP